MQQQHEAHGQMSPDMMRKHYLMFGLNLLISFAIMYFAMFTMIWSAADFFNNLNMTYMALIMLAPMMIVMLLTMSMMFQNPRLNAALYAALALIFVLSFWSMRAQGAVGDRQFLRAMIPHHSGAILMCKRASIRDAEIRDLCFKSDGIVASQSREIDQMKGILRRL